MKLTKTLLPLLLLSACATTNGGMVDSVTPVRVPDLPPALAEKVERLPDITDDTLGGQVEAGIEADIAYNDVAFKYNSLIDLYNCVRVSINEKVELEKCFDEQQ